MVDSDSCYDVSSYRFTPNVAGDYFFFCQTDVGGGTVDRLNQIYVDLRKMVPLLMVRIILEMIKVQDMIETIDTSQI